MAQQRKRSGGGRSGKRVKRGSGWQPLKYLGAAMLGAVVAVAAVMQLGMPNLPDLDGPKRTPAKVEQTAKAEPRKRMAPAPDKTIRTSALPVARPPLPVPAKRPEAKPVPTAIRPPAEITPKPKTDLPDAPTKAALPAPPNATRHSGLNFPICGEGPGGNCVIDGDTFVLDGKAIRVADIDTPETNDPKCQREAMLAKRATQRLQQLLNAGPLELRATARDEDVYGRKLRTVHRDGRSIAETLIAEGLAHRWTGSKKSWCA